MIPRIVIHLPYDMNPEGHEITTVTWIQKAYRIVDLLHCKCVCRGLYGLCSDLFARACKS